MPNELEKPRINLEPRINLDAYAEALRRLARMYQTEAATYPFPQEAAPPPTPAPPPTTCRCNRCLDLEEQANELGEEEDFNDEDA